MISISIIECYRSGFGSPFAFHWNSNQYWWNWANNQSFQYGIQSLGSRLDSITMVWDGLTVGETTHGVVINGVILMDGITTTDGVMDMDGTYNGWNNGYRRGSNVAYNIGRRGSVHV